MKTLNKKQKELKKDLRIVSRAVRELPPQVFDNKPVIKNIEVLRKYGSRIEALVKKHHGIVYGSALFTDRGSLRAGFRKTDDLDVVFTRKTDMLNFQRDVLALLGAGYKVYHGKWTDSIVNGKRQKLIDMHVQPKYKSGKALEHAPRLVNGGKAVVKTYPNKVKGDDPRVAIVKKANAAGQSLFDDQVWRIEKDLYDYGLANRVALTRAKKLLTRTKNPADRKKLERVINKYERAVLHFSADPKVKSVRKKAENKYLKAGKVVKRTFTDKERQRTEREAAKKYGIRTDTRKRRTKQRPKTQFVNVWEMF